MRVSNRLSLTLRLTLLFAAASTVVLLVLGLVIEGAINEHFVEQDMELVEGKLELARHALAHTRTSADLAELPQRLDDSLVGHHSLAVGVIAASGEVLFATHGMPFPANLLQPDLGEGRLGPVIWHNVHGNFRGVAQRLSVAVPGMPPVRVIAAAEVTHHLDFLAAFRSTLWLFVAVAAVLMGVLGWGVTRRSLAPLREMQRGAAAVTASRLDVRLSADAVPVELAALAEALNAMLARLEESFRRLSDFSSDLAHELRTPISNLMTQTQVGLARERSADEYREMLYSNCEEFERLARMVSDMLFLAKADNGLMTPGKESVDLQQEVRDLFDFYEALAEEQGIVLKQSGMAQVTCDRLMLRRAISNVLSNALRHTAREACVQVLIQEQSGFACVSVSNPGETIAAEHLPRLFDRFYRADASRHRSSEGAGLGLAITRSIVQAHGGEVAVRSAQGETCFELRIPSADANFAPVTGA